MSKIVDEVVAANKKYVSGFGAEGTGAGCVSCDLLPAWMPALIREVHAEAVHADPRREQTRTTSDPW